MAEIHKYPKIESGFESIFNHVNEGILIANAQGEIIMVNPKVNQMFGFEEEELIGKKVEVLIPQEMRQSHHMHRNNYMAHPAKRPMGRNQVLYGQRKDGSRLPLEISLSYYHTEGGVNVIAFIIDITDRYEQQKNIERINDQLRQLNDTLERKVNERTLVLKEALHSLEQSRDELTRALEKEKELNELKTRFISMASHEFRTPLSTILSSASLIGKYTHEQEQDKRDKHIGRIKSAVSNLTDILNDFLSLGKLEEGAVTIRQSAYNLCECIEEVMAELSLITKPGQRIEYAHDGDCDVIGDKGLVRNILINLVSNAIKFSPPDSEIVLKSKISGNEVMVEVSDSGIGISEEDQRHLFERFFRAKNATNIQGTGLGLHIVQKYLELLNGRIEWRSQLEAGTTFKFFIPQNQLTT